LTSLSLCLATAWASIPNMANYTAVWWDDFTGPAGSQVNHALWNQVDRPNNPNKELEAYITGTSTVQLTGTNDGELRIIPYKTDRWYSGRLESIATFTCPPGHSMVLQASIKFPNLDPNSGQSAGLWPAFWAMGNTIRLPQPDYQPWPYNIEFDIAETANIHGNSALGVMHYSNSESPLNYKWYDYDSSKFHTWSFKIDLRNPDWTQQSLVWYADGNEFNRIKGDAFGTDPSTWNGIAQKAYFLILNVAVGGGFPGYPWDQTTGGPDSAMTVEYVAVYQS
ncbi:glycoside hydrolase family 16 protein, partial [Lasiosphaeria miniovina]